jgi:phosphocarrier protein
VNLTEEFIEKTVTVGNQMGLHARVATVVVQMMRNFECEVTLVKDGMEVDARSVLGLLLLAATPGSEILIKGNGPDSKNAVDRICQIIETDETDNF